VPSSWNPRRRGIRPALLRAARHVFPRAGSRGIPRVRPEDPGG